MILRTQIGAADHELVLSFDPTNDAPPTVRIRRDGSATLAEGWTVRGKTTLQQGRCSRL
jgi:hypothetical protein